MAARAEVSKGTIYSNTGQAVTTTERDVGLIDSYKEVLPLVASPGDVLTYVLHIVNSSAIDLTGVEVDDVLPWEASTYQRDAVASVADCNGYTTVHAHSSKCNFAVRINGITGIANEVFDHPLKAAAIKLDGTDVTLIKIAANIFVREFSFE